MFYLKLVLPNNFMFRIRSCIINPFRYQRTFTSSTTASMPSSKGTPTDPELREKIKEEVKAEEKGMAALLRPVLSDPEC